MNSLSPSPHLKYKKYSFVLKRALDFFAACLLLVVTSPILLICSLGVMIFDGLPVFFKQPRPGCNEKIFKIIKFRTMENIQTDSSLAENQSVTPLGRLLRKTSLDELPQLFNVLFGELSLVGPRPLLIEYLPLYSPRQRMRHLVTPGITGWAQINGRNAITWEQKFEYDVWYVENWSLALDLKILFLTLFKVLKRTGVNASEQLTMEKFKGSQQ